jgi:DNA polymerase/3'-5' exonuclease PolX
MSVSFGIEVYTKKHEIIVFALTSVLRSCSEQPPVDGLRLSTTRRAHCRLLPRIKTPRQPVGRAETTLRVSGSHSRIARQFMSEPKHLFPLELARQTGCQIVDWFEPSCSKIILAGSIRRLKPMVGDIEILLVPKMVFGDVGELFPQKLNLFEVEFQRRCAAGELSLRTKKDGTISNGTKVKLCRHTESRIPVDFFITSADNWFSSLVCRTGSKESNEEVAKRAKRMGYRWKMSGPGFAHAETGEIVPAYSEADIFQFVGLPELPPDKR